MTLSINDTQHNDITVSHFVIVLLCVFMLSAVQLSVEAPFFTFFKEGEEKAKMGDILKGTKSINKQILKCTTVSRVSKKLYYILEFIE